MHECTGLSNPRRIQALGRFAKQYAPAMTMIPPLEPASVVAAFPEFVFPHSVAPHSGGQKDVYLVKTAAGERVALKLVRQAIRDEDDDDYDSEPPGHAIERVRREIVKLKEIDCKNLERILLGPEERLIAGSTHLWYASRCYGPELGRRLKSDGPLAGDELIRLIGGLLHAEEVMLASAISAHRDIKPGNILLDEDSGEPVLIDLGLALYEEMPRITAATLTRTLIYAAPEQLDANDLVDERTDLFLIGIVAYEAATARHPFFDRSMLTPEFQRTLMQRMNEGPDLEPLRQAQIPGELISFIARCLRAPMSQRFSSVRRAIDALRIVNGR